MYNCLHIRYCVQTLFNIVCGHKINDIQKDYIISQLFSIPYHKNRRARYAVPLLCVLTYLKHFFHLSLNGCTRYKKREDWNYHTAKGNNMVIKMHHKCTTYMDLYFKDDISTFYFNSSVVLSGVTSLRLVVTRWSVSFWNMQGFCGHCPGQHINIALPMRAHKK